MTEYATNVPAIPLMRHRSSAVRQPEKQVPMQSPSHPVPKSDSSPSPGRKLSTDWYASRSIAPEVVEVDEDGLTRTRERTASVPAENSPSISSESRNSTFSVADSEDIASSPPEPPKDTAPSHPTNIRSRHEIPIPVQTASQPSQRSGPQAISPLLEKDEHVLQQPHVPVDPEDKTPMSATGFIHQDEPRKNAEIRIPRIPPIAPGISLPPNLEELATGLEGKFVDEFGNVLDWNGQVLGRVEGDLPSMIGRSVSDTGEIFGEDGEVVGYVAENDTLAPVPPEPQPIEDQLGGGLKVDHMGNILDAKGDVVGHFNATPLVPAMPGAQQHRSAHNPSHDSSPQRHSCSCGRPQAASTPSPSEVYLDVKSTNDGIQLIIKIPTVFNNGGRPTIHIGG